MHACAPSFQVLSGLVCSVPLATAHREIVFHLWAWRASTGKTLPYRAALPVGTSQRKSSSALSASGPCGVQPQQPSRGALRGEATPVASGFPTVPCTNSDCLSDITGACDPGQSDVLQGGDLGLREELPPATHLVSSGAWARPPQGGRVGQLKPEGGTAFLETCVSSPGSLQVEKSLEKSGRPPRPTSAHHKMATELCASPCVGVVSSTL